MERFPGLAKLFQHLLALLPAAKPQSMIEPCFQALGPAVCRIAAIEYPNFQNPSSFFKHQSCGHRISWFDSIQRPASHSKLPRAMDLSIHVVLSNTRPPFQSLRHMHREAQSRAPSKATPVLGQSRKPQPQRNKSAALAAREPSPWGPLTPVIALLAKRCKEAMGYQKKASRGPWSVAHLVWWSIPHPKRLGPSFWLSSVRMLAFGSCIILLPGLSSGCLPACDFLCPTS